MAKASIKFVRVTPRKARLVADLVRGKHVNEALAICANTNKAISPILYKLIKSAIANAIDAEGHSESDLYVLEIQVGDGVRLKRFMPRAKGSANQIIKRTCNIYVTVGPLVQDEDEIDLDEYYEMIDSLETESNDNLEEEDDDEDVLEEEVEEVADEIQEEDEE